MPPNQICLPDSYFVGDCRHCAEPPWSTRRHAFVSTFSDHQHLHHTPFFVTLGLSYPLSNYTALSIVLYSTIFSRFVGDSCIPPRMSTQSQLQIIQSNPIGTELDNFRRTFKSKCENKGIAASSHTLNQVGYKGTIALYLYRALLTLI